MGRSMMRLLLPGGGFCLYLTHFGIDWGWSIMEDADLGVT